MAGKPEKEGTAVEEAMKCISIKQPWAWLIFHGKEVENRTWKHPHRGPLLIHAGKAFDWEGYDWVRLNASSLISLLPKYSEIKKGYIIGRVNMIDCVTSHPSPYFFGPYGFLFADPVEFREPIPYKGKLGLFEVPEEIIKTDDC